MKRTIALSLAALLGASAAFAGGGDLYATKGCHQEYNGYWGFGAGWNNDNNEMRIEEYNNNVSVAKFSGKESKSTAVGHIFLGYSFYNDMPYSVAVEAGMFTAGKTASKTKLVTATNNTSRVVEGEAKREPAYYLALKPRYASGDWWMNFTVGGAATTHRVKGTVYSATTLAGAVPANALVSTKDGFNTYGWMLGVGVGMWFNPNWAVSLDYDYVNWMKEDSKTVNVGNNALVVESAIKDGTSSHFVTLNLKNNFNWMA